MHPLGKRLDYPILPFDDYGRRYLLGGLATLLCDIFLKSCSVSSSGILIAVIDTHARLSSHSAILDLSSLPPVDH